MNADSFRHLYNYHFAENRKIWDTYITTLSDEMFIQDVHYAHGSVRNQIVHLINVDEAWFSDLRGVIPPESLNSAEATDRKFIRDRWDSVEHMMRTYLGSLHDDMLLTKPLTNEEDKNLLLWQVLIHVVNHGTDHRAQVLRLLNDLGVETESQDYIFYVYENP